MSNIFLYSEVLFYSKVFFASNVFFATKFSLQKKPFNPYKYGKKTLKRIYDFIESSLIRFEDNNQVFCEFLEYWKSKFYLHKWFQFK